MYRIETKITSDGAKLVKEPGVFVPHHDRRTKRKNYKELDDNLSYTPNQLDRDTMQAALKPFHNPQLRHAIQGVRHALIQVIDEQTLDELKRAGFQEAALEKARSMLTSFRQFIEDNKDRIEALKVLYSRPRRAGLRYAQVKKLAAQLHRPPFYLDPAHPETVGICGRRSRSPNRSRCAARAACWWT